VVVNIVGGRDSGRFFKAKMDQPDQGFLDMR